MAEDMPSIQPVILAGGAGVRLWPASRRDRPKQLLELVGQGSLLQQTALRLRGFADMPIAPDPIVVTNEDYRLAVVEQLREVGFGNPRLVVEPAGRNTAPALTLACHVPLGQGADPVLLVMAADHLIRDLDAFHRAVAEGTTHAGAGRLVLFGVAPQRPETGYGYIHVGALLGDTATARALLGFAEKPDAATAREYISDGAHLWNSGMFMMRRSVWLRAIECHRPAISSACRRAVPETVQCEGPLRPDAQVFATCPAESIDCAVFEQMVIPKDEREGLEAAVIPLDCGWSDVGGWRALAEASTPDEAGNVVRGDAILQDTKGTLVHSDSRLVATLGVQDLVIVDTSDALLVAGMEHTDRLKTLVARVETQDPALTDRHRRQYRPWGRCELIDGGEPFQVKHIVVAPGESLSLQVHHHRAEHWVVVRGIAEVTCGDKTFQLQENESTYVPLGVAHRLSNPGTVPLEIIEVQSGDYLGEDDIVRLEDRYGRL